MESGVQGISKPDILRFTPKQELFWYSKARHIAFFGGIRSGKTVAACLRGIHIAETCPGSIGVVVRNTHVELNDSTKLVFTTWLTLYDKGKPPNEKLVYSKNDNENWIKFNNGSMVFFRHANDPGLFKGPTYTWFLVDQCEDISEDIAKLICDRLSDTHYRNVGMWVGNTNKGHNWCYRWFKLGEKENSEIIETIFLDNRENLPPDYVKEQLSRPEEEKTIWLYGSWDNPGGLILRLNQLHFVHDFEVQDGWFQYVAVDPPDSTGICGALSFCIDFDQNFFFRREYYQANRLVGDHSKEIKGLCENKQRLMYFDPSAWRKSQAGDAGFLTLVDRYRRYGINPVPAENAINIGVDILQEMVRIDPEHRHPFTDRLGAPHIYFVKERLPNLMEEIAGWMFEDPSKEPVHLCDPLRYAVASRPAHPFRRIEGDRDYNNESWMAM